MTAFKDPSLKIY